MTKQMPFAQIESHSQARRAVESLTDRELEIFQLIGQSHDMHEIADRLRISKKTVEAHRAHIKEKLAITTSRELVRYAVQWVRLEGYLRIAGPRLPS